MKVISQSCVFFSPRRNIHHAVDICNFILAAFVFLVRRLCLHFVESALKFCVSDVVFTSELSNIILGVRNKSQRKSEQARVFSSSARTRMVTHDTQSQKGKGERTGPDRAVRAAGRQSADVIRESRQT